MAFPRETSPECIAFIRRVEGVRTVAYRDEGGAWTIGVGHTGPDVHAGMVITEDGATELLEEDLEDRTGPLKRCLTREPSQKQFDAMMSLAFNIGVEAFRNSTVCKRFNEANDIAAANAFTLWNEVTVKGKRVVSPGLVKRRALEKAMFLEGTEVEPEHTTVPVQETAAGASSTTVQAASVGGAAGLLSGVAALVNQFQDALMQSPWVGSLAQTVVGQYPKFAGAFAVAMIGAAVYVIWHRHDQRQKGLL